MRLDSNEVMPSGMEEYLSTYGWHFSKKLCEYAVSRMKNSAGRIKPYTKDEVKNMMAKYMIKLNNDSNYDAVYVANMCKADFLGPVFSDELSVAKFVKAYIDDPDGYEGMPMTRFYADIIGSGHNVDWEDMI